MKNFAYVRAQSPQAVLSLSRQFPGAKFLGGGTNLVDLMREDIEQPEALIDITGLPFGAIDELPDGGLRIGALVRNSHLASDSRVATRYPLLSQALLMGASGQLRNMATTGGNLMQRTRCYYFYDGAARCNKRAPGSGCDAIDGFNRIHSILGTSAQCIATHPSDMCVAMAALDAAVRVSGPDGERVIPFSEFHRLPGDTPHLDTNLRADELITAVDLPPLPFARRSIYRKVRDRASYAFALVSVAAALDLDDDVIKDVRIALGGVAHKPWRATVAEHNLMGQKVNEPNLRRAVEPEFEAATRFKYNGFKAELALNTVVEVLLALAQEARTA